MKRLSKVVLFVVTIVLTVVFLIGAYIWSKLDLIDYSDEEHQVVSDEVFEEYASWTRIKMQPLRSMDDYDRFSTQLEAKRSSMGEYAMRRIPKELDGKSNGESAFSYFTQKIVERALYLLDEPENSLSASLQKELARFIEDSVRFYKCQFVISTHSPFLLAMKDAVIYDLDHVPATVRPWTELANVRVYYDFFKERAEEFRHG